MSDDKANLKIVYKFNLLTKYNGDRGPKPTDDLEALRADLTDPNCFELIAQTEDGPLNIWRRVHGTD